MAVFFSRPIFTRFIFYNEFFTFWPISDNIYENKLLKPYIFWKAISKQNRTFNTSWNIDIMINLYPHNMLAFMDIIIENVWNMLKISHFALNMHFFILICYILYLGIMIILYPRNMLAFMDIIIENVWNMLKISHFAPN